MKRSTGLEIEVNQIKEMQTLVGVCIELQAQYVDLKQSQ